MTIRDVISQAKVAKKPKDGDSAKIAVTTKGSLFEEKVVVGFYFPYSAFPTL